MIPLLQCHGISHSVGTRQLFRNLSFSLNENSKVGLVGHNGSGKSTLMAILSGAIEPDEGDISRSQQLRVEVVEQFLPDALQETRLLDCLLEKIPAEERVYSVYQAEMMLDSLGFSEQERTFRVGDLSGGQQNRLMFARAIMNEPNLILLDEPTNHLDMKTLVFFEEHLKSMSCSFLLISHDRAFLDAVTDRTLFLRDERIYAFDLPYTKAKLALDAQDEAAAERLKQEEKTIKQLSESAKRLATWGKVYDNEKLAAKAKTMEKRIDKLEAEKTFVSRGSGLHLSLDVQTSKANRALQVEDHNVISPGGGSLFYIEDFYMRPGDRVALLGHNGAGKTTFITELIKSYEERSTDSIRFNPQCELAYFDQEIARLDPQSTIIESLREHCLRGTESEFKAGLIRAGFPYKDMDKSIAVLSGGEKARLMFLIIRINQPNYLILDEPTNHIDLQGIDELETQIIESEATVLITSHDRRFVDLIAERYVVIDNGKLTEVNDPNDFYRSAMTAQPKPREVSPTRSSAEVSPDTEDDLLLKLIELEEKLDADLKRKEKFQKPKLHAEWRAEIALLKQKLD